MSRPDDVRWVINRCPRRRKCNTLQLLLNGQHSCLLFGRLKHGPKS